MKKLGIQDNSENVTIYRAKGCSKCYNTGYKGRIGLFEIMTIDSQIAKLCQEGKSSEEIRQAASQAGMQGMMKDGIKKVRDSITSIEEVMRVVI